MTTTAGVALLVSARLTNSTGIIPALRLNFQLKFKTMRAPEINPELSKASTEILMSCYLEIGNIYAMPAVAI